MISQSIKNDWKKHDAGTDLADILPLLRHMRFRHKHPEKIGKQFSTLQITAGFESFPGVRGIHHDFISITCQGVIMGQRQTQHY